MNVSPERQVQIDKAIEFWKKCRRISMSFTNEILDGENEMIDNIIEDSISEKEVNELYYFCDEIGNRFYCLRALYPDIYKGITESISNLYKSILKISEIERVKASKPCDQINGKTIKKISWSNDGFTGIKINFETEDGYILTYSLEFDGSLKYLNTKSVKK